MSNYYPWGVYWGSAPTYTHTYTRDDLIRAILGQQWAVAIACHGSWGFLCEDGGTTLRLADLPSAHDVVTEMERS